MKEEAPQSPFSIGYHPWYISQMEGWEAELLKIARQDECFAIGETGLDTHSTVAMNVQESVLIKHIEIAKELKKPIVIHCVKSFDALYAILKNNNFSLPIIFHAYNGSPELTRQLLQFNAYFSFGKWLFSDSMKVGKSITAIPKKLLFFETDESSLSIQDIYRKASEILHISNEELEKVIYTNFLDIKKP